MDISNGALNNEQANIVKGIVRDFILKQKAKNELEFPVSTASDYILKRISSMRNNKNINDMDTIKDFFTKPSGLKDMALPDPTPERRAKDVTELVLLSPWAPDVYRNPDNGNYVID
ncbi:hypothetical protein SAMN04487777_1328 [Priestia aryabhattai B8W22]|uniref:hypothetical protein n=1 Tax=Priestia aryabhattai TaxID=412384 RepID=UPI0008880810|nr:hypothetical protein SAMN04487777_1328 [Priestia aryabhattai B8W22]